MKKDSRQKADTKKEGEDRQQMGECGGLTLAGPEVLINALCQSPLQLGRGEKGS